MKHLDASASLPLESIGVPEILRECAAHRSPALVVNLESKGVSNAEFRAYSEEAVILNMFFDKSDFYPVASLCSVHFVQGDFSYVFLARVLGFYTRPSPEPCQLELDAPLQIAASKGHIRHRVPVYRDSGLKVQVITESQQLIDAQALNLSLTGILIEFAEGADPHLSAGASLHVALGLGDYILSLAGEVVRTHCHQCGIFFRDPGDAGMADAPEPLRKIVRMLERRWLQERIRSEDQDAKARAGRR
jgi:hypothetical protein